MQMKTTGSNEPEGNGKITDATSAYKSAKAIQKGWKLWCVWSVEQPVLKPAETPVEGFVVQNTADMRKMAMDLLAMADAVEEIESMWEE